MLMVVYSLVETKSYIATTNIDCSKPEKRRTDLRFSSFLDIFSSAAITTILALLLFDFNDDVTAIDMFFVASRDLR